ncbi:histone H3-like centromeric protein HTR12 isoform X3 [Citrus clementina]|uniref:histone H3-like centromeric protein HTR12 isoform X3 n=1 Tax=Citrus clementina TaxID=85681 RepID=UPI000CED0BAC|nr:histone H3-like centromeric protein HTR12 isoform X3 [Citrus x clementina]
MARTKHMARRSSRLQAAAVKATPPTSSPGTSRQRRSEAGEGTPTAQRKRQRLRPGTKALREIRRFQKSVDLLIPRMSFIREVRTITYRVAPPDVNRWTPEALIALQELEGREDPGCFGDILSQWFLLYL